MSPNLLRALLLVLLIVSAIYLFSGDSTVSNQGSLSLDANKMDVKNVKMGNGNGNDNGNSNSNGNGLNAAKVNMVANPQVQNSIPNAVRNAEASAPVQKRVQFNIASADEPGPNDQVLPFPQPSTGFNLLNGNGNNYADLQELGVPSVGSSNAGVSCFPRDTVTAKDLLPSEDPLNAWSQVNPATPGHLSDQNYLESGHHFGINTVGSSRRNPNLQLRSDPYIPQVPVSIWNQSTFEPDTNRRAFEIGSGCD